MKYAVFKIIDEGKGDVLTIDGRFELPDNSKPLGLWALKSKAVIITQEEFEKIRADKNG